MKSTIFLKQLRKFTTLAIIPLLVAAPLQITLAAEPNNSVKKITRSKHLLPGKPASRLAIIAAVKEKYKGRILSVRKQKNNPSKNCHHVKMIDERGEFLTIQVACKSKKK